MHRRLTYLSCLLLLLSSPLYGQSLREDLEARIQTARSITFRAPDSARNILEDVIVTAAAESMPIIRSQALNYLGAIFSREGKKGRAENIHQEALAIAEEEDNGFEQARSYGRLAGVAFERGDYALAIARIDKGLAANEPDNNNAIGAALYANLTIYLRASNQYTRALEAALKSLSYFEAQNDSADMAIIKNNIGYLYYCMQMYKEAEKWQAETAALGSASGNDLATAMGTLGMADAAERQNKDQRADSLYQLALQLYRKIGIRRTEGIVLNNMGEFHLRRGNLEEAEELFGQAREIFESIRALFELQGITGNLGELELKKGNPSGALVYFRKVLQGDLQASDIFFRNRFYKGLSEAHAALGHHQQALEYYKEHAQLKDSILNIANHGAVAALDAKYQSEKRENELREREREAALYQQESQIAQLKADRRLYWVYALIALVLVAGAIALLFFRQNRLRQQQQQAQMRHKLLRTQMNPHFVFNSLSVIQSYMYDHDPMQSGKYLLRFSRLMRNILENSAREFIHLDTELEILNDYLTLQEMRFGERFSYVIEVPDALASENPFVPPMLAQPLIENALEHGRLHEREDGKVEIAFFKQDDSLFLEVRDNGIGRKAAATQQSADRPGHKSKATAITQERIALLRARFDKRCTVSVRDADPENGSGTVVRICLPYLLHVPSSHLQT